MILNPDMLLIEGLHYLLLKLSNVTTQHYLPTFSSFQPVNPFAYNLDFLYHTIHQLRSLPTKHN